MKYFLSEVKPGGQDERVYFLRNYQLSCVLPGNDRTADSLPVSDSRCLWPDLI